MNVRHPPFIFYQQYFYDKMDFLFSCDDLINDVTHVLVVITPFNAS